MASLTKILSKPGSSDGLGDMERRLIVIETEMPYLKDGVKRVETKMDRVLSILDSRDNKA